MVLLEIEKKLKQIMTREINLFSLYKEEFSKMKTMVIEKNWISLQRSFETVELITNEIESIDKTRDELYGEICTLTDSDKNDSFFSVMKKIHNSGKSELIDIYRMVRNEARSIRVLNKSFSSFIQNRRKLVDGIMEELVPDRKGTIYNRSGFSAHNQSSSSLVLDKHL